LKTYLGKKLILIRHAPVISDGLFYGSREVACRPPTIREIENIRNLVPTKFKLYVSKANRCLTTANFLFPSIKSVKFDGLREQHFGSWEGISYDKIPNIGTLSSEELADFQPPNGESFNEMSLRVNLVLEEILNKIGSQDYGIIVAHAGTIRAVLSKLIGKSALSFQVDNLSMSEFIFLNDGMVVNYFNRAGIH
jgi:alpha-ribazole phosphatase